MVVCIALLISAPSCKVKRKEYIEKNGLHSDKKPHEMAAEIGKQQKKQQKEYNKALKKRQKRKARTGRLGKD